MSLHLWAGEGVRRGAAAFWPPTNLLHPGQRLRQPGLFLYPLPARGLENNPPPVFPGPGLVLSADASGGLVG